MGLDMYLEGTKFKREYPGPRPTEDGYGISSVALELAYWRKHPDLHGYIVQNFNDGFDDCSPIDLDADRLRQIAAAVRARRLPHTTGFFFGSSGDTPEYVEDTALAFDRAAQWLETEDDTSWRDVAYRASW